MAAEMSFFSKIDHFYSCGWDAMVLGNETSTFLGNSTMLENQTKLNSSDLVHITSDSGNLVKNMPKITSVRDVDCHSDSFQDQRVGIQINSHEHCQNPPNAKRKRNVSSSCKNAEVDRKQTVDCKENFVHIRARKGQATSNHSLAERVRRERISERMRLLQELVPGCDKITGKAVVLDEIINYVQSLQHQVEFLSMKLATVDPELNVDIEQILPKDLRGNNGVCTSSSQDIWNNELQSILQTRFYSNPSSTSSLLENGLSEMEL